MTDNIIPTTEEVTELLGGPTAMRELVKTVLLYSADDIIGNLRGDNAHDHIEDDCGDDMHGALTLAYRLQGAWHNGGEHSLSSELVMLARDDDMADLDTVSGMDLSDLRMNHACGGICAELDAAVKKIRGELLHLPVEEE